MLAGWYLLCQVGAGLADLAAPRTIDLDSTIAQVLGWGKQVDRYGCTKVLGYRPTPSNIADQESQASPPR